MPLPAPEADDPEKTAMEPAELVAAPVLTIRLPEPFVVAKPVPIVTLPDVWPLAVSMPVPPLVSLALAPL
jgi:hypothetical protein